MTASELPREAFEATIRAVSVKLGCRGIGLYAPTLLTANPTLLHRSLAAWGLLLSKIHQKKARSWPVNAALPIGLHLEGPFLQPEYAGAHPPRHLLTVSRSRLSQLLSAAGGWVKILTIAPELSGALVAIPELHALGIRVQLGHSKATTTQALAAFAQGAQGITHLYNAMRTHHRDPGLLAGLQGGRAQAEIITDGIHVHPLTVYAAAKHYAGRVYGVSDCCSVGAKPLAAKPLAVKPLAAKPLAAKPLAAKPRADGAQTRSGACTLGSIHVVKKGPVAMVADREGKPTQILAGAATLLSEHPERLFKALARDIDSPDLQKTILFLFRDLSAKIASECLGTRLRPRFSARFDSKTLHFLGIARSVK